MPVTLKDVVTGTQNYAQKPNANGVLIDTIIYDNGTNVGIGTNFLTPSARLHVVSPNDTIGQYGFKWSNNSGNRGVSLDNDGSYLINGRLSIVWANGTSFSALEIAAQTAQILNVQGGGSGTVKIGTGVADSDTIFHIKGKDSISSNYSLKIDNSSSSPLLYVRNDGFVGIGTNSPSYLLQKKTTSGGFIVLDSTESSSNTAMTSTLIKANGSELYFGLQAAGTGASFASYGSASTGSLYQGGSTVGFNFISTGGYWRFYNTAANVGNPILNIESSMVSLNQTTPTSMLDVNGSNGYSQFRMRQTYTPTSTADANGNNGDVAYDATYLYLKTGGAWGRIALNFAF